MQLIPYIKCCILYTARVAEHGKVCKCLSAFLSQKGGGKNAGQPLKKVTGTRDLIGPFSLMESSPSPCTSNPLQKIYFTASF